MGAKVPSEEGERCFVCHIGNASGFVPNAKLIFRGGNLEGSDITLK